MKKIILSFLLLFSLNSYAGVVVWEAMPYVGHYSDTKINACIYKAGVLGATFNTIYNNGTNDYCTYYGNSSYDKLASTNTDTLGIGSCTSWDNTAQTCGAPPNPCASTLNQIITQSMGYDAASSVCISGCSYDDVSIVGACSGTTCTGDKFKGKGTSCTASNGSSSLTEEQKCLQSGMSFGEVTNGTTTKTICVPKTTQGAAPTVTNANGTKTTVNNGVTTVTNTTTNTNTSNNTVTKTTVTTNPDGSTSTKVDTQDIPSFCEENPNSTVCNPEKVEGSEKGNPNGYTAQNGGFYESKYPNGITGIWDNAKTSINATGAHNAINALSPNFPDSGTAPSWTFNFNMGQAMNFGNQELATNDAIWAVIRLIFLITTLFTARSIIFGG